VVIRFRLGLRRSYDLGDELGLPQFGVLLSDEGPFDKDVLLSARGGQWPRLSGGLLRLVDFGLILGLGDGRLPGVLGLVAQCFPAGPSHSPGRRPPVPPSPLG